MDLSFMLLILSTLCSLFLLRYVLKKKPVVQIQRALAFVIFCILIICIGLIVQKLCVISFHAEPIYFENFIYIGTCLLPVAFFIMALSFVNTKIVLKKSYLALFIVPMISLILLWTNDFHHLFYEYYSFNMNEWIWGSYFYIHTLYSYSLLLIGLIILVRYSIKNAGFFSKQSILIVLGGLVPLVTNVIATLGIIPMTVYMTPIAFTVAILCITLAIFKFDFLSVTPIALQRIVDRMSDSYVVLNEDNIITDFNRSFLTTFKITNQNIRNTSIFDWDKSVHLPNLETHIQSVSLTSKTISFEVHVDSIDKYFNVEVSSIVNKGTFLGTLILFKDITQHMQDLETIQSNQDMLVEKERFASLGQMIGGIAHNLKTPIMSIAGAAEALIDLVKEYEISIGDTEVTNEDHHEIANDMASWISKIKTHTSYMSDVITAVKGQAVETTDSVAAEFTIEELVKRVNILMKHELKHSLTELNVKLKINEDFTMHGDVNCLVQVINNLISNAIQSYNGSADNQIDFIIEKTNDSIILSIKDYGCGMSKEVQEKLFKGMVTTKGKNGTGLGLFMSYSNVKAHFNGDLVFESKLKKGTTFSIIIPCA